MEPGGSSEYDSQRLRLSRLKIGRGGKRGMAQWGVFTPSCLQADSHARMSDAAHGTDSDFHFVGESHPVPGYPRAVFMGLVVSLSEVLDTQVLLCVSPSLRSCLSLFYSPKQSRWDHFFPPVNIR